MVKLKGTMNYGSAECSHFDSCFAARDADSFFSATGSEIVNVIFVIPRAVLGRFSL
jgi:hypothetical protein